MTTQQFAAYDDRTHAAADPATIDEIVDELARLKPGTAPETQEAMDAVARDTRTLVDVIRRQVKRFR